MGLGTLALAQPLLLAREEAVRFLWAGELLKGLWQALAEVPAEKEAEKMGRVLGLLAGSLEARDPALLKDLEGALKEGEDLARVGDRAALELAFPRFQALVDRAVALLVPEKDPPLLAALLVQMALADDGVAESYGDASQGEEEAYYRGFVLLGRLEGLYAELKPSLSEEAQGMAQEALEALKALYPGPSPIRLADPEDAERAALDLAFALEKGLGVELLPRDPRAPWARVRELVDQACTVQASRLKEERWLAARALYEAYLKDPLQTLAAGVGAALEEGFKAANPDCERLPALLEEAGPILGE